MSTINILGPVGYNPTGNYDPTRTYQKLDVVYYQGSSYVAISDSLGQLPTNSEYWNCIAAGSLKQFTYDTVADMKADNTLSEGMYASTVGYYEANDGGAATYKITSEESETEYQEELENGLYATIVIQGKANVKQFGAYGDNTHDDTIAINKALLYSSNVYIPDGEYLITSNTEHTVPDTLDKSLIVRSNQNITLSGGAYLKEKAVNSAYSQIFLLYQVNNVKISGGHLIGELLLHEDSTQGKSGHGIDIISSHNVIINNINISYTWGDSICVTGIGDGQLTENNSTNIKIVNCDLNNFQRNGISCIGASEITILNNNIHNALGVADNAIPHGIDLESNYSDTNPIKNVFISDCIFDDNLLAGASADIVVTALTENVEITNCIAEKISNISSGNTVLINNCNIKNLNSYYNTKVNNCNLYDINNNCNNKSIYISNSTINGNIYNHSTYATNTYINNCLIDYLGESAYIILCYDNSNIYIQNSEIQLNQNLTTRICNKMYIENCTIYSNKTANTGNISYANDFIFKGNILKGNKLGYIHVTRPSNTKLYIDSNIIDTVPTYLLSGQDNETGSYIITNNTFSSSFVLNNATTSLTNLYSNNNYYPN